jgi:putative endonuclease
VNSLFSGSMKIAWLKKLLKLITPLPQHLLVGRRGEQCAKKHLSSLGMKHLTSNFSCESGEIDLIFREGEILVFVEVKTRTQATEHGLIVRPAGAVNQNKRDAIHATVKCYLRKIKPLRPVWRVDIVEVILDAKMNPLKITHIQGVPLKKGFSNRK